MYGIILGAIFIKYMGVSRINWIYKKPRPEKGTKCLDEGAFIYRTLSKFQPEVYYKYDWAIFQSLKRYSQVWFYIWFVLSVDSLNFFLRFCLWVPAESDVLKARVCIWAFTAIVATKEFYIYIDDPNCIEAGPFLWLGVYTICIEYSIWFKHIYHEGYVDFPLGVKLIVSIYILIVIIGAAYSYSNEKNVESHKKLKFTGVFKPEYNILDPIIELEDTAEVLKKEQEKAKIKKI
jgi:phosphatidylserine synthase 2